MTLYDFLNTGKSSVFQTIFDHSGIHIKLTSRSKSTKFLEALQTKEASESSANGAACGAYTASCVSREQERQQGIQVLAQPGACPTDTNKHARDMCSGDDRCEGDVSRPQQTACAYPSFSLVHFESARGARVLFLMSTFPGTCPSLNDWTESCLFADVTE
jgi:hypothetical protein